MSFVSLNERAHQLLAEVLAEHGITRGAADETYERGITRAFLPHGLGHLLGLQVHDAGGRLEAPGGAERDPPAEHPFLRLTRTLEPGFVVTIEPGLYFIPALLENLRQGAAAKSVDWDRVAQWLPYGGDPGRGQRTGHGDRQPQSDALRPYSQLKLEATQFAESSGSPAPA